MLEFDDEVVRCSLFDGEYGFRECSLFLFSPPSP